MSLPATVEPYAEMDARIVGDLRGYCAALVHIQNKAGELVPFVWREAQVQLHAKLERQREARGLVRAIVLKARRLGISTYVGARFYHRATMNMGRNAFILTHEDKSTQELFDLVRRIHLNMPPDYRPVTGSSNAYELDFTGLDGGYRVGTAKNISGTGRALTLQLFHGCLSPGTMIVDGATGQMRPMGTFRVGDLVVTHTGALAPISAISRQRKRALRVAFKGLRDFPLVATAEHRFWTRDGWCCLSDLPAGGSIGFPTCQITSDHHGWPFRLPDTPRPQGGGTREVRGWA